MSDNMLMYLVGLMKSWGFTLTSVSFLLPLLVNRLVRWYRIVLPLSRAWEKWDRLVFLLC